MTITYKKLKAAAALYAVIPILIFFIGWLNVISAVVFGAFLIFATVMFIRNSKSDDGGKNELEIPKKKIIILAAIALVWCWLAGHGEFFHQSSDNEIRDAIFRDLIRKSWPVIYGKSKEMMCYYICQWMVPSVIGKAFLHITSSDTAGLLAGNISLLLWDALGCFLVFMLAAMICCKSEKPRPIIPAVMYIFFSGLDNLGVVLTQYVLPIPDDMKIGGSWFQHYEWWAGFFQYSSNTTCLFWVYNQSIVPWIITLCLVNEKRIKNFAYLGLLMFPFGPFPFVGAVIICVIKAICIFVGNLKQGNGLRAVKDIFTLQNIFAMLSVAPVYILYYTSNSIISNSAVVSGEHVETSFRIHDTLKTIVEENDIKNFLIFWLIYLLFILLEVGVYFIPVMIGNRRKPKDMTFILSCASLLLIPLFQVGVAGDFAMRVSIPALTYLCITFIRMVMERIPEKGKSKNFDEFVRKNALLCVSVFIFLIGTTTPIIEIEREAINTAFYGVHSEDETILESLEDNEEKNNFAAANYTESTFYKYLCKH